MVELLDSERAILGEGPVWVAAEQCLYWVDIKGRKLNRYRPADQEVRRWHFPDNLAWVLPRQEGGLIAGTRHEIGLLTLEDDQPFTPCLEMDGHQPSNRLNDAKVDLDGTILFGTMDDGEQSATGAFYRLLPDFTFKILDKGYVVSNGPAIDPVLGSIYHTDSAARRIYKFDREEGGISNKKIFVEFSVEDGFPDGMTVDCEGGVWVAHWGGGRVSRFLPDGRLDYAVPVPASQVTSCCFGGENLDHLFITTASINLSDEQRRQEPHAGCLFTTKVGVKGVVSPAFLG